MSRKKSRKKSADAKILQKLNEIDREFKSMERFRLSMVKSRKTRIMKRIKKGEPADYKGYKKELTARVKTHLTRVNKSIKAYSKILKKSRKPRKKTLKKKSVKKSRKPRKKKSVKKSRKPRKKTLKKSVKPRKKKSVKKSRKPRKKKSVKKSRKPRKKKSVKKSRKKMKMCGCGLDVHFRMKKISRGIPLRDRPQFYAQIVQALKICGVDDEKIYHMGNKNLLSKVISGQMLRGKGQDFAKHTIFSRFSNNKTPFELIEAAPGRRTREAAIEYFYKSWLCSYATKVKEQARIHKEKKDDEFLGSHEFGKLSVDKHE